MAGVVLNAGAVARLLHHLDVVARARLQPFRLQKLALRLEVGDALRQFHLYVFDGEVHLFLRCNEVLGGINLDVFALAQQFAGERVHHHNALHFVAPELDANAQLFVCGQDFHRIAADAKLAARKVHIVALILHIHQLAYQVGAAALFPAPHIRHEALILFGRSQAEYAGYGRHYERIAACEQRPRGGVAELVQLFIDVGVFLDVGIGARHIGFGLVVVVVAYEILHGVVGEELFELGGELSRERLVVRDNQRWTLRLLDDARHSEGLAAAGNAQQRLVAQAFVDAGGGLVNRMRLVARRREIGNNLKVRHIFTPPCWYITTIVHQETAGTNGFCAPALSLFSVIEFEVVTEGQINRMRRHLNALCIALCAPR